MFNFESIKHTLFLRTFAFMKIPLLWWVRPTVIEMTEERIELKIPLCRRTKNHLGVMYFGALAMGGEAAIGLKAQFEINQSKKRIDFLFKDFQARFLKRAEGDVHFVCEQGKEIRSLIGKCSESEERQNQVFQSYAIIPSLSTTERIAEFEVTLTAKKRLKK